MHTRPKYFYSAIQNIKEVLNSKTLSLVPKLLGIYPYKHTQYAIELTGTYPELLSTFFLQVFCCR